MWKQHFGGTELCPSSVQLYSYTDDPIFVLGSLPVEVCHAFARLYFWWPKLDDEIASIACDRCAELRNVPPSIPLVPWPFPPSPWSRIHVDHAGPMQGQLYFVVVNAHSKCLEVFSVLSTSCQVIVKVLQKLFMSHGLPRVIVSDNATSFKGEEFQKFMSDNGIVHITSAPHHPATNGLAERAVQTFKNELKKMANDGSKDTQFNLQKFLFKYRTTPHPTTGSAPAELLMGRRLRTRFDLLHPSRVTLVLKAQAAQKRSHDKSVKAASFEEGDKVWAKDFTSRERKWQQGRIVTQHQASFDVELPDGGITRRHAEQLLPATPKTPATPAPSAEVNVSPAQPAEMETVEGPAEAPVEPVLRRSERIRRPPQRLIES
jgi:hypothetical protein